MVDFHRGSGVIKYDPYRAEMKRRTDWWCIVDVDREITRYYRWWLKKEHHIKCLEQPSWDAHISVIRGESQCKKRPDLWKKYHNKQVDFLYQHGQIRSHPDPNGGTFYWVDVECPFLGQIRKEMGLPIGWRFHITVGRTYY